MAESGDCGERPRGLTDQEDSEVAAFVADRLNGGLNKVLRLREVRERLKKSGAEPVGGTPKRFAALIRSETAKYAKLLKELGMARSANQQVQ